MAEETDEPYSTKGPKIVREQSIPYRSACRHFALFPVRIPPRAALQSSLRGKGKEKAALRRKT